jgi:hypothetical protein
LYQALPTFKVGHVKRDASGAKLFSGRQPIVVAVDGDYRHIGLQQATNNSQADTASSSCNYCASG